MNWLRRLFGVAHAPAPAKTPTAAGVPSVAPPRPSTSPSLEGTTFAGPYYTAHFDMAKLPPGANTDYFLNLFWNLFSLESISQLLIRAGRLVDDPGCYAIALQSNQAWTGKETGENKLIGDRFVRFRDNPPVSELTCVTGNFREGPQLPLIAVVDGPGRIRFADHLVEQSYDTAKKGTSAGSLQINLDPRWSRVLDRYGQYISISGSTSKVPVDEKLYPRVRLHTFFRDHAHADQVLDRIPDAILTIPPTAEGPSSQSGQSKYHVTHEGDLKGSQIKEYLQIVVEGGGEIWEALL